ARGAGLGGGSTWILAPRSVRRTPAPGASEAENVLCRTHHSVTTITAVNSITSVVVVLPGHGSAHQGVFPADAGLATRRASARAAATRFSIAGSTNWPFSRRSLSRSAAVWRYPTASFARSLRRQATPRW